jgi:formylglycine-generating enzyme required for sulfatase activity
MREMSKNQRYQRVLHAKNKKAYSIEIILVLAILLVIINNCTVDQELIYKAELIKPPVNTRQLGPAIFLPEDVLMQLRITEGQSILALSDSMQLELRAYMLTDSGQVFSMQEEYSQKLGLELGQQRIILKKINEKQAKLKPQPIRIFSECYYGDLDRWVRIAYGAPHGDCDLETGAIVKLMTNTYGIPSTAGYGSRLSYRGKWFDMNRPLMKLPKPGGGTYPDRIWNQQSEAVYQRYQDSVWQTSNMHYGKRFDLFCSFHGHDLTVRLPNGDVIERPVMEAMGAGFTKNQLRKIKKFYENNKTKYYKEPPLLVFGNLPEDLTYYYQDIPLTFFYSGLGARVYGSLKSDLVKHALHIETPNTMRLDKEVQHKTAKFLYDLFVFVNDSILLQKTKAESKFPKVSKPACYERMVSIPGGSFIMGTEDKKSWSSERPAHQVNVDAFKIDYYEVTNEQYVNFLNKAYASNEILVEDGVVQMVLDSSKIICRTTEAAPMSQIEFNGQSFYPRRGKEYFPVIFVSYHGVKMYADYYDKRIPTEAEWEKAASWDAHNKKKHLYAYRSDDIDYKKANFEDSGDLFEAGDQAQTTPVGWYKYSGSSGTYDMSGNVFEWCADFYDNNYYEHENQSNWINPQGPEDGTMRTIRGGAWNHEPWITRTTFRLGIHPNATLVNVGFRCVKK